jgi:serine protease AprX
VASYSSRGPTVIDGLIKPDLVAPGNRIESLLAPGALLAKEHPELVIGTGPDARLQLSGTSMAAAVVSGAAAVLRSGADIAPVTVRVALQTSSEFSAASGVLGAGAGELNLLAAARLKSGLSAGPTEVASEKVEAGGVAFAAVALLRDADNILWGTSSNILWGTSGNILWGTSSNIFWGTSGNILWGTSSNILWGTSNNILWGTSGNILWGTSNNILWGTSGNILWGTSNNILWGTSDNILWGTSSNILWGTSDNILWGTSDNILWGTSDNILWGTSSNILWGTSDNILWGT